MKIPAAAPVLLTGTLLALAACDSATTAPSADVAPLMPHAFLGESGSRTTIPSSTICRNNLKQIALTSIRRATPGLFVHDSSVEVDRGGYGDAAGSVFGHLLPQPEGEGCGEVQVQMADGSVRFVSTSVHTSWDREPLILALAGEAEFCPTDDGPCDRAGFTGNVHVMPAEGQAIFQLSTDDSEYQFAARTYLVISGQDGNDRLQLTDGPAALWMDDERSGSATIQLTGLVGTLAVEGRIQVDLVTGRVNVFRVLLGLLVREGNGYSWLVHTLPQMDQPDDGRGQRRASLIVGSELLLQSGPTLQDDDTWILGGVVYQRVGGDWICL